MASATYQDKLVEFYDCRLDWHSAQSLCRSRGGHLWQSSSFKEREAIIGDGLDYNDPTPECNMWHDYSSFGGTQCAHIDFLDFGAGGTFNADCSLELAFVCERPDYGGNDGPIVGIDWCGQCATMGFCHVCPCL